MEINLKQRNPEKFDTIELYEAMSRELGYAIDSIKNKKEFTKLVEDSLNKNLDDKMIHGKHTESMFGYIASSLGNIKIIKKEDSGDIFSNEEVVPPDYNVILKTGETYFIEVKNFYQKSSKKDYKLDVKSFDKLNNYSKLLNKELLFAIYWAKWNMWTLVKTGDFVKNGNHMVISFEKALKVNNMIILGDAMIGAKPNLSIRVYIEKETCEKISDFAFNMTIKKLVFFCDNKEIEKPLERNIAFGLIMGGNWGEETEVKFIKDNTIIDYIEFTYFPIECDGKYNFDFIGILSQIMTNQYKDLTIENGKIVRLSPKLSLKSLGITIPADYKSDTLPLWIFSQRPNYEE